jgi:beta-glucosidase
MHQKIILCLGEKTTPRLLETSVIYLSAITNKISPGFIKLNKPIILVLNEGRPRLISDFEDKMNSSMLFTRKRRCQSIGRYSLW